MKWYFTAKMPKDRVKYQYWEKGKKIFYGRRIRQGNRILDDVNKTNRQCKRVKSVFKIQIIPTKSNI